MAAFVVQKAIAGIWLSDLRYANVVLLIPTSLLKMIEYFLILFNSQKED